MSRITRGTCDRLTKTLTPSPLTPPRLALPSPHAIAPHLAPHTSPHHPLTSPPHTSPHESEHHTTTLHIMPTQESLREPYTPPQNATEHPHTPHSSLNGDGKTKTPQKNTPKIAITTAISVAITPPEHLYPEHLFAPNPTNTRTPVRTPKQKRR